MNVIEHVEHIESRKPVQKKYCILVSGLVRGFYESLFEFLKNLDPTQFDIYLHFSNNDTKFMNCESSVDISIHPSNFKQLMFDLPKIKSGYSNREINTFFQYYRLQTMVEKIDNFEKYSMIVRVRPDIHFSESYTPSMFETYLNSISSYSKIYIPNGYDIFDRKVLSDYSIDYSIDYRIDEKECINDQFAICSPIIFKIYANIYNQLITCKNPLVSEHILYTTLVYNKIEIERIDIDYSLVLSKCNTIAISGDSSSGKSYLLKLLSEIFPYDQRIIIETDRYHKYDRYNPKWNYITHLDPEANNLEKMANDLYCLKLGDDVFNVDYDHKTGKFTEVERIESKPFVLLCGLHTLYSNDIRSLSDLKIYMDTPCDLKMYWKVIRDVHERNHSLSTVLHTIEKRKPDFDTHILPQKQYANIVIQYVPTIKLPIVSTKEEFKLTDKDLRLIITLDYELYLYIVEHIHDYFESVLFDFVSIEDKITMSSKKIAVVCFKQNLAISYNELLKTMFRHILYKE